MSAFQTALAVLGAIAVPLAVVGLLAAIELRRDRETLRKAAALLAGAVPKDHERVEGKRRDVIVSFALRSRGRTSWTEVAASVPPVAFILSLRPQPIFGGSPVDVVVGDADFDPAFVVEAAPADVARKVLTPTLRAALLRLSPCTLDIEGGAITLRRGSTVRDGAWILGALECVAHVAAGLGGAAAEAEAEAAGESPSRGGPYRTAVDVETVRRVQARRKDELDHVMELRERRARRAAIAGVTFLVVGFVLIVLRFVFPRGVP